MSRRYKPSEQHSTPEFHLETLETRILFSADAAFTLLDIVPQPVAELVLFQESERDEASIGSPIHADEVQTKELVILDSALPDLDSLLADLLRAGQENTQVLVLNSDTDVLTQISHILEQQQGLTTLHVISHGSSGVLELGGQRIETLDLLSRAEDVASWRSALVPGADILLYGCEVASDGAGRQFVDTIARLTGADVSASSNLTGSTEKGGDWQLEYHQGDIESLVAVSAELQDSFSKTLVLRSVSEVIGSYIDTNISDNSAADDAQDVIGLTNRSIILAEANQIPVSRVQDDATVEEAQSAAGVQTADVYELVFVDTDTVNYQQLVDDLLNQGDGKDRFDVFVLDNSRDGIEQISEVLANYDSLDAVHIISHGFDGAIDIGATRLDSDLLNSNSEVIAAWGEAFDVNGDLLIYGCDLASTLQGQSFVDTLASITGTDVAASIDLTGHASLGGNWDLEYLQGDIETAVAPSAILQQDWSVILAPDITTGLFAYWNFDADADDASGNNYHGALQSSASIDTDDTTDIIGEGKLSLGGSGDRVNLDGFSGDFNSLTQGTISAWVNTSSVSENTIFGIAEAASPGSNLSKFSIENGQLKWLNINVSGGYVIAYSDDTINDGNWHHVAVTVGAGGNTLYIDGAAASTDYSLGGSASETTYFSDILNVNSVNIGSSINDSNFEGLLDEVRLYDRALSATDVAELASVSTGVPSDLISSATSSGGFSLNIDGGNDAYLHVNEDLFAGNTAVTIEVDFSIDTPAAGLTTLFSYATGTSQDELYLGIDATGEIFFRTSANGDTGYGSIDNAPQLFDGERHSVAVTWENTTGVLTFYVDGEELGAGRNDYQKTTTIDSGGTAVIGQHQTSPGAGFDVDDTFSGTLHDVRLFSDVRLAEEIASSYRSNLPYDEDGLIANWHFDVLSGDGVVTESVNGNNLTVMHTAEIGFASSEASLTFALDENALNGTVVGSVVGVDAARQAQIDSLLAADSDLHYNAETDKFYKVVAGSFDWDVAKANAESTALGSVNGQLATIRSAAENLFVQHIAHAPTAGGSVFLGGTDGTVEGEWRWIESGNESDKFWDGAINGFSSGHYANWEPSTQPNNSSGDEEAIRLDSGNGLWYDAPSTGSGHNYIVEWTADDVLDVINPLSYSINSQTVAGTFTINADNGQISVANGSLLDYDTHSIHTLVVRVTDIDANTYDETFTVSLNDLVESNNSPSNLSSGIELNTDGGNDAYLEATNGSALLGGLNAFTLETSFSLEDNGNEPALFSYYVSSDEIRLRFDAADHLRLKINNVNVITSNTYSDLLDGNVHHVAVSWDNTNGDVIFYIDGEFAEHISGLEAGHVINAGGVLAIGNDQDGLGSGYKIGQSLFGTLYDIRVWDEIRSAEEIALNKQSKFVSGSLPSGLIANWQMDGFDGSDQIVDIVSGNNLSIGHATGTGFVASAPVEDLHVSESAGVGTIVGYVVPSVPDVSNDLVSDGGFLKGDTGAWTNWTEGQTFGDWTVELGDVSHTAQYPSPGGGVGLELQRATGEFPSAITQTLDTEAGRQYQLIFNMTGNFPSGDPVKYLTASAGGESKAFEITETAASGQVYGPRSMMFTADSTNTLLRFAAGADDAYGAVISDVRVIEIPPAVSIILNNDPTLSYDAGTGKFYRFVDTDISADLALLAATGDSLNGVAGQLVTIRSDYENELTRQLAIDSGKGIWLGAVDTNNDGNWNWLEGSAESDEQFWKFGSGGSAASRFYAAEFEQSEAVGEDYARLQTNGVWADSTVGGSFAYVVEWDATQVLSSFTFTLSDASDNFQIESNSGKISVSASNTLDYEAATSHDVDVTVTDASGQSYVETITITVDDNMLAVNQVVPGPQSVNEDEVLTFTGANAVSVSDSTASTDTPMQITLSVNDGVLNLDGVVGITFVEGAQGTGSMTFNGTESDINTALDGMTFTPDAEYNGSVTLTMTTALSADLEGYYSFAGANANDQSAGTVYNGTFVGNATTTVDGTRGEVLSLDGIDDSVSIAGTYADSPNVTLSAWVNLFSADTNGAEVISLGDSVVLRVDDSILGGLTGFYYDGSSWIDITANGVTVAGTGWNHVAYVFDDADNTHALYLNGVVIASSIASGSISYTNGADAIIGSHGYGDPFYDFNGLIDDARIHARALSSDEIAAIYEDNMLSSGSVAITVDPVNDAPALTNGGSGNLAEGSGYAIFGASTVSDIDSGDFDGGSLTVSVTTNAELTDVLGIAAIGGVTKSGSDVLVGGTIVGTYSGGTGGTPLVIAFNSDATLARVQSVHQAVAIYNSTDDPVESTRTIEAVLTDGDGGTSNTATAMRTFTATNDAPVAVADAASVDEGSFVTINLAGNDTDADDALDLASIVIVSGPANGLVTLNGNGTVDYSHDGSEGVSDSFTYTIQDASGAVSNTATVSLSVTAVNDAATINNGFGELVGDYGGSTSTSLVGNVHLASDNRVAVDPSQTYDISVTAFSGDGAGGGYDPAERQYLGFYSYDIDGNQIYSRHVGKVASAVDTTLAVDLVAGATEIVLADATGWYEGAVDNNRSLAWYGYTNSLGETYADYTYTQTVAIDLWNENAIVGNVITLRTAWAGPTILAGDAIRNMSPSGGTYQYPVLSSALITETPNEFTATIGGGLDSGSTSQTLFRHGTAYISPLVLANFTGATSNQLNLSDFTISSSVGTSVFTEGDAPIAIIDEDFSLTDPDDTHAEQLTVTLSGGKAGDIFRIDEATINGLGITVSGIPAGALTGDGSIALTLSSDVADSVTFQDFEDALAGIKFENISADPDTSDRTITFIVNDGENDSAVDTLTIQVNAVDDAPIVSVSASSPTWTENGGSVGLFTGTSIDAVENGELVSSLIFAVDNVADGASERLIIDGELIELTDLFTVVTGTSGYDIDVSVSGSTATVTISSGVGILASASETLVDNLSYDNASETPSGTSRTVTFVSVSDSDIDNVNDTTSVGAAASIAITGVNDAPVMIGSNPIMTAISEDEIANTGDTVATLISRIGADAITDADNDPEGIAIFINNENTGTWQYQLDGSSIWVDLGAVSSSNALLLAENDSVRLLPNGVEGSTANFGFRAWDQSSGTAGTYVSVLNLDSTSAFSSDTKSAQMYVSDINDAPVESIIEGIALAYTENQGAVGITSTLALGDVDDTNLDSALVQVVAGYANSEDVLTFVNQNGISGSWNAATGVMNLTGSATVAQYEAALRSITYSNNSQSPNTLTRTISFTVNDGDADSNMQTRDIVFTSVNNAPTFVMPELIANGTFDTNLNGWATNGQVQQVSGELRFGSSDAVSPHIAVQSINTIAGGTYELSFDYRDLSSGLSQSLQVNIDGAGNLLSTPQIVTDVNGTSFVRYTYSFTADSNATTVTFTDTSDTAGVSDGTGGVDGALDNISVLYVSDVMSETTFVEDGSAVVLGSDVEVFDVEISNGVDTFDNTTLTMARTGSASAEDVFSATGLLGALTEGGNLVYNSMTVGTVSTNSGGTLLLTFNAMAGNSTVNNVVQAIAYSNSSDAPPVTVQIDWTFDDSNDGTQGTGGVQTVTGGTRVTIVSINDSPVISSDGGGVSAAVTVYENQTAVTTVTATDVDAGDTKTYSLSGGADEAAFVIDGGTGVLTFATAPDHESQDTYEVEITVTDNGGLTDVQTLTVTVDDVNEAPVITSDGGGATASVSGDENQTAVTTLIAADEDAGATQTYTLSGGADQSAFTLNASTGALTFLAVPDRESQASYEVEVTVTDDGGLTDIQTLTVTVTDVNEAPVITSDGGGATAAVSVAENQTAVTTVTATDVDAGATQTYSLSGGADQAAFTLDASTGVLSFIAAPDLVTQGSYEVEVTVTDDGGLIDIQTLTVSVNDVNEAPVITSDGGGATAAVSVAENQTAVTTVTATDVDAGATQTYSLSGGADQAAFAINVGTGALTFLAAPDRESQASYEVEVTVTDDGGLTDIQTLTVTLADVNEAPVITSDAGGATAAVSVAENQTAVTTVTATDVDAGATQTYSLSGGTDQAAFAINVGTGALTFLAAPDRESQASYEVEVTVTDDGGLTDIQTLTVTVTDVNEAPVITSDGGGATAAVSVAENQTAVTTVTATDVDAGATQTYSLSGGADQAAFAINASTGALTFLVAPDHEDQETYEVEVTVTDDGGLTDVQTLTVTVTDVNEAPVITSDGGGASAAVSVAENQTAVTTVMATDVEAGATQTYSLSGGTDQAAFTLDASTGVLSFITAPDHETQGSYEVEVTVSDDGGLTDVQMLTVTVNDINETPVITSDGGGVNAAVSVAENQTAVTTVTATDVDAGATQTYSLSGGADQASFTLNASTGVLSFITAPDHETQGSYEIEVTVTDNGGLTDSQTLTVSVTDVNEAPAITSDGGGVTAPVSVNENQTNVTTVTATDIDAGATQTYSLSGGADLGAFALDASTGVLSFITAPDHETQGSYEVEVTVTDNGGLTDSQTLTVSITDVNEAPAITSDGGGVTATVSVAENQTAVTTVTATDVDAGATQTYSLSGGADQSAFAINTSTGALTFLVAPDHESQDTYEVEVTVTDDGGLTDSQILTVTVNDVNEAPLITSDGGGTTASVSVAENQTAVTTVTATDVDASATQTYSLSGGADQASFTLNASTGVLSFITAPNHETQDSYEVEVTVTDNGGLTDNQSLTVSVTDVNEAPVITSDGGGVTAPVSVNENQTTVTTVTATDVDAGATQTYSLSGGADLGAFTLDASTGMLSFITAPDHETQGSYEVEVTVMDNGGLTDSQTLMVTLTDVNEAPVITSDGGGATASVSVTENQTAVTTVTATDVDAGATQTYSLSGGADQAAFTLNASTGELFFITAPDREAQSTYEVEVTVTDNGALADVQRLTITVGDVNEAPVITSNGGGALAGVSVNENQTAVTTVTATDVDAGATLTYSLAGGTDQAAFTLDSSTGVLTFNSAPDYETKDTYEVRVSVTDNDGLTTSQTLTINLQDVNELPTAQTDTLEASDNRVLSIDPLISLLTNDSDPERGILTLVSFTQPQHGTLTLTAQGLLEYEPDTDFVGMDSFDYEVEDSGGNRVSARVWLDVQLSDDELGNPTLAAALEAVDEVQETLPVSSEKITSSQEIVAPTTFTPLISQAIIDSESLEYHEPVSNNEGSTSNAVSIESLFATSESRSVTEHTGISAEQPPSNRPGASIISGLLQQILDHEVSYMDVVFELNLNDSYRTIELRDAILALRDQIDQMVEQSSTSNTLFTMAPTIAGASFTAGVVTWVLRSGLLISATLSATPLWRPLDPVPILSRSYDDHEPFFNTGARDESGHGKTATNSPDSQDLENG